MPDPLVVLFRANAFVTEDGVLHTTTPEAARLVELLALDRPQATELRMTWIGIIALAKKHDETLYCKLMGYPDDLPNLSLLRLPGGKCKSESIATSFFALRSNGSLPETY